MVAHILRAVAAQTADGVAKRHGRGISRESGKQAARQAAASWLNGRRGRGQENVAWRAAGGAPFAELTCFPLWLTLLPFAATNCTSLLRYLVAKPGCASLRMARKQLAAMPARCSSCFPASASWQLCVRRTTSTYAGFTALTLLLLWHAICILCAAFYILYVSSVCAVTLLNGLRMQASAAQHGWCLPERHTVGQEQAGGCRRAGARAGKPGGEQLQGRVAGLGSLGRTLAWCGNDGTVPACTFSTVLEAAVCLPNVSLVPMPVLCYCLVSSISFALPWLHFSCAHGRAMPPLLSVCACVGSTSVARSFATV